MRKIKTLIIPILVSLIVLCGCFTSPLKEQHINTDNSQQHDSTALRTVYVSGAVSNDGYVEIPQICDYKALFEIAGLLPCGVVSYDVDEFINAEIDEFIVNFEQDGVWYDSINANGYYVIYAFECEGVTDVVIGKLSAYINERGKIRNRADLRQALGDLYDDNFYKFYIERSDYETDS